MNKFTLPLVLLNAGVDVFWLDLDVFIFQNPTSLVQSAEWHEGVDLMVRGNDLLSWGSQLKIDGLLTIIYGAGVLGPGADI
jgi:hypothetical protein